GCTTTTTTNNDTWAISSLASGTGVRLPMARQLHTAVWTGAELIVWGGWGGGSGACNEGGVYEAAPESWLLSALASAPAGPVRAAPRAPSRASPPAGARRPRVVGGSPRC